MALKLASVEKCFAGIETYFAEFETVGLLLLGVGVIRPPPPLTQGPTQTILHGTVGTSFFSLVQLKVVVLF